MLWYDSTGMSSLTSAYPTSAAGRYPASPCYADWQSAVADSVREPAELCQLLELPPLLVAAAERVADAFPLLVPRTYLSRIRIADPRDPLLLQVLPSAEELAQSAQFCADPLLEADATREGMVLGKYPNRLLILSTGLCAVHCRFCFRRHFPYREDVGRWQRWKATLAHIAAQPSVTEVLLSGGDPLSLGDDSLRNMIEDLEHVPHLRRLRIHSRFPVMIPQRITGELLDLLRGSRLTAVMVFHLNHPAEIDEPLAAAIGRLVDAGVPVLQQGVLLRGVNDQVEILAALYERLIDLRVMPYYLHQLDRVAGAAHFEVAEPTGVWLIQQLRQRLPGYAVPRYVRETANSPSKTVLA